MIELPLDPRRTVNAVLIEGEFLTLVDTGDARLASVEELERGLAARGYRVDDLQQIVITHAHTDHFGAARYLRERSSARLVADALGRDVLADYPSSFQWFSRSWLAHAREAGVPDALLAPRRIREEHLAEFAGPAEVDAVVAGGDSIVMGSWTWQVIDTPGHALSEVSFFEPATGTLISGDIVLGNGGSNVTLYPYPNGRPSRWIQDILASLDALARLRPDRVLPGHGPEFAGGAPEIAERAARVRRRLDEVADVVRLEPVTAWDLSLKIYQPPVAGTTLGVAQSIGYLEALEADRRVASDLIEGKRVYRVGVRRPFPIDS